VGLNCSNQRLIRESKTIAEGISTSKWRWNQPHIPAIKARQSNHAVLRAMLWRSAPRSPRRYLPPHVQPLPHICKLNRPFPPISLGSGEPVCGKRGFSGLRFYDVKVAQVVTETGTCLYRNPIYVLFYSCHILAYGLKKRRPSLKAMRDYDR